MLKDKINTVKQSNQLARACLGLDDEDGTRGKLNTRGNSPWLERILNLAITHIKRDDTDLQELVFPISELGLPGKKLSGKDYQDIKASLTELARSYYSIENVKEQYFEVCAVFSRLLYEKGVIKVEFNKAIKPHLVQISECFTVYEFSEFRRLGTAYAQKMFRFLKSWRNVPEVVISLEHLHKSLGTTKSLTERFINFKQRVLEPVHAEITEQTRFWYEWEPVKTKNKVTAIRFFFKRQALPELPKSPEQKAKEEHDRLQHESNQCYEKIYIQQRGDCIPKKRSARCKFCVERGRMYVMKKMAEYREQSKSEAVEQ
jgi:plasmid replication initiation protein